MFRSGQERASFKTLETTEPQGSLTFGEHLCGGSLRSVVEEAGMTWLSDDLQSKQRVLPYRTRTASQWRICMWRKNSASIDRLFSSAKKMSLNCWVPKSFFADDCRLEMSKEFKFLFMFHVVLSYTFTYNLGAESAGLSFIKLNSAAGYCRAIKPHYKIFLSHFTMHLNDNSFTHFWN